MKQHLDLKPTNEPNQTNQTKPKPTKKMPAKNYQTKPNQKMPAPNAQQMPPPTHILAAKSPRGLDLLQVPFDLEISGLPGSPVESDPVGPHPGAERSWGWVSPIIMARSSNPHIGGG